MTGFLNYWLVTKAPVQLPDAAKEWLVQYGPWITIVLLVLTLPALLFLLGIGTMLAPVAGMLFYSRVVGIVTSLLAGNIVSAAVGGLISLYILFQVRPLYKI